MHSIWSPAIILRSARRNVLKQCRPLGTVPKYVPPIPCTGTRVNHNVASEVTKVEKILLDNIKATGPLSFATYMQLCLGHPTHGYYMNPQHPVFGPTGDFITSPEISQVFGELVGIWFVSQWAAAGQPPSVRLVELGPGRGTLMADILRTISKFGLSKSLTGIHLVETSEALRAIQEKKIETSSANASTKLNWYNHLSEIPRSPSEYTILVAHEFFDALPIHVLQKQENGWHEVLIASTEGVSPQAEAEAEPKTETGPRMRRVLSPKPTASSMLLGHSSTRFDNLPVGSTIEVSPTSFRIAHQVGRLLAANPPAESEAVVSSGSEGQGSSEAGVGGCGLIIDYGGAQVYGDSFRAFKQHAIVDPFHLPGECDLTANVDFAYLKEAMHGLVDTHGPISQADFLERMGLQLRVKGLLEAAQSEERRKVIEDAANRLVDRSGMGKEYQVLGITSHPSQPKSAEEGRENEAEEVYPFVQMGEGN